MAVDFTPILSLLILVIPIILIVAILKRFLTGKLFVIPFLALFGMSFLMPLMAGSFSVMAVASLSPSSGTLMTDLPVWFSAEGLTASTAYSVNVTVGSTETVAIAAITSNSDGELSFSLTFTTAASTTVEVITGGSAACTGTFNVVDIIDQIMPYIVIGITLSIVFGLAAMLGGIVKRRA